MRGAIFFIIFNTFLQWNTILIGGIIAFCNAKYFSEGVFMEKQETREEEDFLKAYTAIKLPERMVPINTSKHTFEQQLKRFSEFSHTKEEIAVLDEETRGF
jgi:hypothetical protein